MYNEQSIPITTQYLYHVTNTNQSVELPMFIAHFQMDAVLERLKVQADMSQYTRPAPQQGFFAQDAPWQQRQGDLHLDHRLYIVICMLFVCCLFVVYLFVCCLFVICLLFVCYLFVICLLFVCLFVCLLFVSAIAPIRLHSFGTDLSYPALIISKCFYNPSITLIC